jgi:hypothetical protein
MLVELTKAGRRTGAAIKIFVNPKQVVSVEGEVPTEADGNCSQSGLTAKVTMIRGTPFLVEGSPSEVKRRLGQRVA